MFTSLTQLCEDQLRKLPLDKLYMLMERFDQTNKPDKLAVGAAVLVGGLAYCVTKYIVYPLYFHPLARLPGPPVDWIPLLGNMREELSEESIVAQTRWVRRYGPVFRFNAFFNAPRVTVCDPVLFKQILTIQQYDFTKTSDTASFLSNTLGHGLLVAEGEEHKRQRKLLNPAFSLQSSKNLAPFVYEPVFELFKHWDGTLARADESTAIEVSRWMSLVTLDVIGLAAFGEHFNSVKYDGSRDKINKLSQAYSTIFDPNAPMISTILRFLFPAYQKIPTRRNIEYSQAVRWLREESEALVHRGIERAKAGSHTDDRSLLSLMINFVDENTGKGMTPEELREQCMTFLAAGHETTAVSLSWCLWLLAQNQDIQDQLRAEVMPVFKDVDPANKSTYPDFDTVDKLHFLNNICKENARLIPVVPGTTRQLVKDVNLGGHFIPKDTILFLHIIGIHHDKKIWGEDAEVFRPDRWDEEPANKATPYEYMPFLAGGRQCIGYRFALIELKIILGLLLTKYQFFEKLGFKVRKQMFVTMRPAPNMTLLVKPVVCRNKP